MKTTSLPNLRGLVSNNNRLKIEIVKAINTAITYAKRSALGYSPAANSLATFFVACSDALRTWTHSVSLDVQPATATKAAAATQQITATATFADAGTVVVTADPRCTYATSDATKATVNAAGLVTAVATGTATITASFQGRTDTLVLTIS